MTTTGAPEHAKPWLDDGGDVTIRRARAEDERVLRDLAALSSARALEGDVLVAEVNGELRAALGLRDGRVVSDPFRPTANARALLELRRRNLARALGERPRARALRLLRRFAS